MAHMDEDEIEVRLLHLTRQVATYGHLLRLLTKPMPEDEPATAAFKTSIRRQAKLDVEFEVLDHMHEEAGEPAGDPSRRHPIHVTACSMHPTAA